METTNKTLEEMLISFMEKIKKVQENEYNKKETVSCLIDLHINTLNALEQIGDNEEEQLFIKALMYDCFKKREEERLKALWAGKGESHE